PVHGNVGVKEVFGLANQVASDGFFGAQNYVALDQVLEFANVARPVIFLQHAHQLIGERLGATVVFAVVELEEVGDQVGDVGGAIAQRRHLQVHNVDAVEQILAEI